MFCPGTQAHVTDRPGFELMTLGSSVRLANHPATVLHIEEIKTEKTEKIFSLHYPTVQIEVHKKSNVLSSWSQRCRPFTSQPSIHLHGEGLVIEWSLQDACRENDLIRRRLVVGIHISWHHFPSATVINGFTQLLHRTRQLQYKFMILSKSKFWSLFN